MLALAERVEKATADQQAPLLIEAFDLVDWRQRRRGQIIENNPNWFRFDKMIRAEAYESAAMALVPEGLRGLEYEISVGGRKCSAWVYGAPRCHAATPALALVSAALRARHAEIEERVDG